MAKSLQRKLQVEIGSISLGKKDTARLGVRFKFDENDIDANGAQILLAGAQLRCRFDKSSPAQGKLLPPSEMPKTTVEFDATSHNLTLDLVNCACGLSFPKASVQANDLAEFAGQNAKLTVTRTGDADTVENEEGGEGAAADEGDTE